MKLMNPVVNRPHVRFYKDEISSNEYSVNDKKFLYDANSMAVYDVSDGEKPGNDKLSPLIPQFFPPSFTDIQSLVLEATHACNLACTYCFVALYPDAEKKHMSIDVATRAMHMLTNIEKIRKMGKMHVGFFGGEPTVNWEFLVDATNYSDALYHPAKVSHSITTNACLITPERAKFLKNKGFSFIVSLDGREHHHNLFRKNHSGKGSYQDVMKGLGILNDAGIRHATLRSTFLPQQLEICDRIVYLNELCDQGVGNWVSVEPAYLSECKCHANIPDDYVFTPDKVKELEPDYMEVAKWFVQRIKQGKQPRFHHFYKTIERLLYRIYSPSECGSGRGYLSVNPYGEVYACHRETNSKIGHLDNGGVNEQLRAKWCDNRSYVKDTCMSCPMRWCCGGGCRENSIGVMGNIHEPDPVECAFKELFFRCSLWIMSECTHDELIRAIRNPTAQQSQKQKPMKQTGCNNNAMCNACAGDGSKC